MLDVRNVDLFYGERKVLASCSFSVQTGERLALMGPSGCGKTSALRVVLGLQKPNSGEVHNRFHKTTAAFQEPRLFPWASAEENLMSVLPRSPGSKQAAQSWLLRLGLADASGLYPSQLSGGMQQRLSLARAFALQPELLVLDEPFQALDDELKAHIAELIRVYLPHTAILMTAHSVSDAQLLSCRALQYRQGQFLP